MTFAEVRKFVVAVLGAIVGTVPQILAEFADVIPQSVATWATIVVGFATAILVYLIPNGAADPLTRLRAAAVALAPAWDAWRAHRAAQAPSGSVASTPPIGGTGQAEAVWSTPGPKGVYGGLDMNEPNPIRPAPVDVSKPDADPVATAGPDAFTVPPRGGRNA